ncbi:PH domain-containing protein [Solwaraspora sp. WMMA2101]|uniref:PH domain-containing protein n=1 Tax=Solwaraspora sp. WMMA2101 TaxID=3404124 RepID=UPI003B9668D3
MRDDDTDDHADHDGPVDRPDPDGPVGGPDPALPPATSWRVPAKVPVAKVVAAALVAAVGLLFADGDPIRSALGLVAAAGLTGWAVRDLLVPVRLTAGPQGVEVVTGLAGRRAIDWQRVESITVDRRGHRGVRTALLEIDAGDSLHLLGGTDLGADPADVAAALTTWWHAHGGRQP